MNYRALAKKLKAALRDEKRLETDTLIEDLEQDPAFRSARRSYLSALYDRAKASAFNSGVTVAKQRVLDTEKAYRRKLSELNLTMDDVSYGTSCKICGDSAIVDGRICTCVLSQIKQAAENLSDIPFTDKTFADFRLDLYEGEDAVRAARVLTFFKKWESGYPDVTKRLITLSGKTGVGKSYLSAILATALIERGYDVAYLNAFSLNKTFLKAHTSSIRERDEILSEITDADVLFIDDLGVEQIYKNVTCEYLYDLLTERQKKATFITTNLSPSMLLERYDERIFSRLKGSVMLELTGKDLR